MSNNHLANISIKFRICLSNVYWLFCLTGYLRFFPNYNLKQICDKLGKNTDRVDCSEYYQKTKDLLQDYKQKHASCPNITKEEREAIKTLKEDDTLVVLTADKGVAMVVMDKSSHVNKCMTLLQDANVLSALQGFNQPNSQTSPGSTLQTKRKTWQRTSLGAVTIQSTTSYR